LFNSAQTLIFQSVFITKANYVSVSRSPSKVFYFFLFNQTRNLWHICRRVRKIAKTNINFVTSFCPTARNYSSSTERIFMIFNFWVFFENLSRKFHWNMRRITSTLHKYLGMFIIISRRHLLRMRKFSGKFVEKINTPILCSRIGFPKMVPFMQ